MRVAYVRVSSTDQNLGRQLEALNNYDIEKLFSEKISGKNMNRPEFKSMMNYLREGDTLYIESLSRLSRDTLDTLSIVDELSKRGVIIISLKENLDTSTPSGRFMLTVYAGLVQLERENILERQREGIALAKASGKYKGRKQRDYDESIIKQAKDKKISITDASKKLGCTRQTVYNLLNKTA